MNVPRGRTPTVFCNKARGCTARCYPGNTSLHRSTLKGLCLWSERTIQPGSGHNSFGVGSHSAVTPRVASAPQPWALLLNTFGVAAWVLLHGVLLHDFVGNFPGAVWPSADFLDRLAPRSMGGLPPIPGIEEAPVLQQEIRTKNHL